MIDYAECPKCHSFNWFSNGDMSDLTRPDLEALECWQCGHKFWLDGAADVRETLGESLDVEEASFIEKGAKTPNEAIREEEEDREPQASTSKEAKIRLPSLQAAQGQRRRHLQEDKGTRPAKNGSRRPSARKAPTQRSGRLTAKENLLQALKSQDPTAIAHATVQYALESPETITAIQNSLRLVPFLIKHGPYLQGLPARERHIRLEAAWREIVGTDRNEKVEKIVVDAAMKALSGRPRK